MFKSYDVSKCVWYEKQLKTPYSVHKLDEKGVSDRQIIFSLQDK